jgi:hypothetical protein
VLGFLRLLADPIKDRRIRVVELLFTLAHFRARSVGSLAREGDRAAQEPALYDRIGDPERGLACINRFPESTHFDCFGHARKTRQPLCAGSFGNDSQFQFRLAVLPGCGKHAVVASHFNFQRSTECGGMDRHDGPASGSLDFAERQWAASWLFDLAELANVRTGDEGPPCR